MATKAKPQPLVKSDIPIENIKDNNPANIPNKDDSKKLTLTEFNRKLSEINMFRL